MDGIEPRTTTLGKRDLTTKPENSIVATRGQEVCLDCGTNLPYQVTWWFTPAGSETSVEFYFSGVVRPTYASKFEVDTSKDGHYTVVIRHLAMDHSGRYTCYDNEGEGPDHASVELTVIGKHCILTFNSSQYYIAIRLNNFHDIAGRLVCFQAGVPELSHAHANLRSNHNIMCMLRHHQATYLYVERLIENKIKVWN